MSILPNVSETASSIAWGYRFQLPNCIFLILFLMKERLSLVLLSEDSLRGNDRFRLLFSNMQTSKRLIRRDFGAIAMHGNKLSVVYHTNNLPNISEFKSSY